MASFESRFRVREPRTILKTEDKKKIHDTSLTILEKTGMRIDSQVARGSLKKAGALIDEKSKVVKFPRDVVNSLLRTIPHEIVLAGRTKEFDLPVDGSHYYFTTDGCGVSVWDGRSGTRRESRLDDIRRTAVLADWLPYLSIYLPMVVAHDVPSEKHVVSGIKTAMENTTKHIETESTSNPVEARAQIRMASEVVGSLEELRKRHYISAMVCTISPLVLEGPTTDAGMVWAENHVPVHMTGMAMMGMSGPATIAGDLALNHAETLGLACAIQAHEPGAPLLYGSVLSSMNPRSGAIDFGSSETMVLAMGSIEMARFMRIPCSCAGIGAGSRVPGVQGAVENAIIAAQCAMVGGEVMNGIGLVDNSTVLSYEQMMIDNEIVGLVINSSKDIPVNDETLALDLVRKVGIGGTFLAEMHTLKHAREFYTPTLWSGEPYDTWVKKGKKDMLETARDRAERVLKEHSPEPMDKDISKSLGKIVDGFGKK